MRLHSLFRTLGFDVIRYPAGTSYLTELKRLLDLARPDLVADVGGNRGQFVELLRAAGYDGDVVSFEPVARTSAALIERARGDSRWTVEALGMGDRNESRAIRVPNGEEDDMASFLSPTELGLRVFPELGDTTTETVEVRRLDEVLADREGRLFLKIDTQGWELPVLEGARGILDQVAAVQTELVVDPIYAEGNDYLTVLAWLRDAGFTPTAFVPVAILETGVCELDCLLRRTRNA